MEKEVKYGYLGKNIDDLTLEEAKEALNHIIPLYYKMLSSYYAEKANIFINVKKE